jgi:hypothetical protein
VRHVIAEHLADHALGESPQLSTVEHEHLLRCIRCSSTVDELRAILTMTNDPASAGYAAPVDPRIWLAIKARLGTVKQLPARARLSALPVGSGPLR